MYNPLNTFHDAWFTTDPQICVLLGLFAFSNLSKMWQKRRGTMIVVNLIETELTYVWKQTPSKFWPPFGHLFSQRVCNACTMSRTLYAIQNKSWVANWLSLVDLPSLLANNASSCVSTGSMCSISLRSGHTSTKMCLKQSTTALATNFAPSVKLFAKMHSQNTHAKPNYFGYSTCGSGRTPRKIRNNGIFLISIP